MTAFAMLKEFVEARDRFMISDHPEWQTKWEKLNKVHDRARTFVNRSVWAPEALDEATRD